MLTDTVVSDTLQLDVYDKCGDGVVDDIILFIKFPVRLKSFIKGRIK